MKGLLVLLALAASPMAALGQLQATIKDSTLLVEGVTAGGRVALLSVWREQILDGPHTRRTVIEETLSDDDADGIIEFSPEEPTPLMSIWAVVDEDTGEHAVAVPDGFSPQALEIGALATGKDAEFNGREGVLQVNRPELQVLIVRPKEGRWRGLVRDGVSRDADLETDRLVTLKLDELEPGETASTSASALLAGDVVIAIDPHRMTVLSARL